MAESKSKFVKAYCNKTHKYFGLECQKIGREYKVVNFIDIKKEEAELLTSEISQSSFETNSNLLPCESCNKRKVGGCGCRSTSRCSASMPYDFQCIYCNNLSIDYSDAVVSSDRVGEKIVLSQGQEVVIRAANNKPMTKISVGCGWKASSGETNIDVDSSILIYTKDKSYSDMVYFGSLTYLDNCIVHHGDNLVGHTGTSVQSDDENIDVDLSRIPQNISHLAFVINIYNCIDRGQDFSTVRGLYIRLMDPTSRKSLIEYRMDQNFGNATGLVVGIASRKDGAWTFKAIGEGVKIGSLSDFSTICQRYLPR